MKVGLILGGGGEVGIAWEIGVLAALEREAGFTATTSEVIAGTSAGAIVGAYAAQGRSLLDLAELERNGSGVPVGAGFGAEPGGGEAGNRTIPDAIISALMSTEGTLEARGARLGKLALEAPVSLDEVSFVAGFRTMLGADEWPEVDFRPTTVQAESGQTILWDEASGIGLGAAVASSCAVPGVFPPVQFDGHHFIDVPRRPFSRDLVKSSSLDAIIFVGLILPILANNNEQKDELAEQAAAGGLAIATVTGGPGVSALGTDLLDHSARVRAVEVGLDDGQHAAEAVKALMSR
ncbi:MAG TPA: patatin-like phospholipase family protein [Solirubrobacteraceae bacterium]